MIDIVHLQCTHLDNSYEDVQCTFLAPVDTIVDWVILIGDTGLDYLFTKYNWRYLA